MSSMIGNRIHGRGPGGRECACCAEAPGKGRKAERRATKRRERASIKKEIRREY